MRDDDFFAPKPATADGVSLSASAREALSVEELEARVRLLEQEIAACQTAISAKRAQRSAADALFGGSKTYD